MKHLYRSALVLLCSAIFTGATNAAPPEESILPSKARIMTPTEIYDLYRDKSWEWENGAGFMKDAGRRFRAWKSGEEGKSWAEGRWVITRSGGMCLDATWHTKDRLYPSKTCFSHRVHNGTIYQKREPDGNWYVFSHAVPRVDDEAKKLTPGDLVSEELEGVKAALSSIRLIEQPER